MNVFGEAKGGNVSFGFRMGAFKGFRESGDGGVKGFVFTAGKDNLNRFFGINEGREVFEYGISTFTTGDNEEGENVGVEFKLTTDPLLVVGLLKLLTNKPTRGDDFFSRDIKVETGLNCLRVKNKIVSVGMGSDRGNGAGIGDDVDEGEGAMSLVLMNEVVVGVEAGDNTLRFL